LFGAAPPLLGLVLLTAASLKGYEFATVPAAGEGLWASRWLRIGIVELEIVLGLCLFFGVAPRFVRGCALACFLLFAGASLYKVVLGETSCGCFGKVRVHPGYTLAFDVVAVAALVGALRARGGVRAGHRGPWRYAAFALVLSLVCAVSAVALARSGGAEMTPEGEVVGDGPFVYLNPLAWVGQPFPLVRHIDIGDRLAEGEWVVILYRHDCPKCRWVVPEYERLARVLADQPGSPKVALVEVPPYGDPGDPLVSSPSSLVVGRLNDEREWFVEVPAKVRLKDGKVMTAATGPAAQQVAD
jgi:hypothetical protein